MMDENVLTGLLQGDLPQGKLVLLYGRGGTDKTNLAILCAVNHAVKGLKVLYVDADGSFSRVRLDHTIIKYPEAVSRIFLAKPWDFDAQGKLIRNIELYAAKNVGLLVFESINFLYRWSLEGSSKITFKRNRELNLQLGLLSNFVRERNITVLLTSQVRSRLDTGEVEPVAARLLKRWCDIVISLVPDEDRGETTATLEKPKHSGDPPQTVFKWLKYRLWLTGEDESAVENGRTP
jgi:RecA/RadA recombinase